MSPAFSKSARASSSSRRSKRSSATFPPPLRKTRGRCERRSSARRSAAHRLAQPRRARAVLVRVPTGGGGEDQDGEERQRGRLDHASLPTAGGGVLGAARQRAGQ